MADNLEQLIFDLVTRDRASAGLSKVGMAARDAGGNVDTLTKRLDEVGRKTAMARVGLQGDRDAEAKLDAITARLLTLDRKTANPNISVEGAARAIAEISALDLELDKLGGKNGTAEAAAASMSTLAGGANVSGMGAAIAAGVILSPIIATLSVGLGGLGLAAYGVAKNSQLMGQLLAPLKADFNEFSKSLQPQVLNAFGDGILIAQHGLHDIQPVAAATGKALDGVLGQIDAEFQSGTWQQFFGFMARTAGPDVQLLGNVFIQLAADLPPLLEQLQPLAEGFLNDTTAILKLVDAGDKAIAWEHQHAQAVSDNTGMLGKFGHAADQAFNTLIPGAKAAGVAQRALDLLSGSSKGAGSNMDVLAGHTLAVAHNTDTAWPTVSQMANHLVTEKVNALGAASAVGQLNSAWSTFLGMSASLETAQIGIEQQLTQLTKDAHATGASFTGVNQQSLQLQNDFESGLVPSVQNVINSARQAGATNKDLAKVLSTDLKPAVDAGALSNKALRTQIYDMALQAGYTGPNALKPLKAWVDGNATSSQNAANKVNNWAASLANLPKGENITVKMTGNGYYQITENGVNYNISQGGLLSPHAAGGLITGGVPGRDSVVGLLMPGEVVVPTGLVRAGAVDHLRGMLPGFAGGGIVTGGNLTPGFITGMDNTFRNDMLKSLEAGLQSGVKQAIQHAMSVSVPNVGSGVSRWGGTVLQALAMEGLPSSLESRVLYQIQTESGGNPNAINLTDSNAAMGDPSRGLLQTIMSTFQAYHWPGTSNNIYDPLANIAAAINYARHVYGPSLMSGGMGIGSGHGYDSGGYLPTGLSLAYNGTGVPERVIPPNGGGGGTTIIIKVDPAIAAVTPDRNLGRQIAEHLLKHTGTGGRLYPQGVAPR